MTRFMVIACAFIAIGFGLGMQFPIAVVGGTVAALVGLAPWSHDHARPRER